jgi:hypothetical protein
VLIMMLMIAKRTSHVLIMTLMIAKRSGSRSDVHMGSCVLKQAICDGTARQRNVVASDPASRG